MIDILPRRRRGHPGTSRSRRFGGVSPSFRPDCHLLAPIAPCADIDERSTPTLWQEIEERAVAAPLTPRRTSWVLVAVGILLALALGGAAVVGLGIIKLPV